VSPSVSELIALTAVQAPFEGWTLVDVSGRHRERFLQSQLTSDVAGLEPGGSQLSALLDRSGRLQAFFFLGKMDDCVALLVPGGCVAELVARLEAHVVADDVPISRREVGRMRLALGPEAVRRAADLPPSQVLRIDAFGSRGFVTWADVELEFESIGQDELEARRVVSGLPRWGVEADRGMLVNETTLIETAVSFNKGCFLGQETVAKVASHRGAAYHPVLLVLDDDAPSVEDMIGRSFAAGGRAKAGVVRSRVRWQDRDVLQVSMFRDFRVDGLEVECRLEDGTTVAGRVARLPLIRPPTSEEEAGQLFEAAAAAFSADRETEAVDLLERLIEIHPGYADAYESLGVILGRGGRYTEAIALMRRLLEVDPTSVMAHTNMSLYFNRLGMIDAAEREARNAAVKETERRRHEQDQVAAAQRAREETEADLLRREQMFAQVLEIDPDDQLANFGMGELCASRDRFEEAARYLERVIEVDEGYSAAYLALGRAWEGMRRPDRARRVYEAGIAVAARRGDLATANQMQDRLRTLSAEAESPS
jgi:folate-binding protein YgfZ